MSASVCGYVKQVFRQDKEGEVTLEVRTLFTPPEIHSNIMQSLVVPCSGKIKIIIVHAT